MSDPYERLRVPSPVDRHFPGESRQAAAAYVGARRGAFGAGAAFAALLVVLAVLTAVEPARITWAAGVTLGLILAAVTLWGTFIGQLQSARRWLFSLRRLAALPPLPHDVTPTRYARAIVANRHAAGELETALLVLCRGEAGSAANGARRVLARHDVPDVSTADYELRSDVSFPMWDRHGVPWSDAPLPDVDHTCQAWTLGVTDPGTAKVIVGSRCACGGLNDDGGWVERNTRRTTGRASV